MEPSVFQKQNHVAASCTNGIYMGTRADSCESSLTLVTDLLAYSISAKGLAVDYFPI